MLGRRKTSTDTATSARLSEDGGLASRLLRGRRGQAHGLQENPLLSAFAKLRAQLKYCHGMLRQVTRKHRRSEITACRLADISSFYRHPDH